MSILEGFFPIIIYPLSDGQPAPFVPPIVNRTGRNFIVPTDSKKQTATTAELSETMYGGWVILGLSVVIFYYSPRLGMLGVLVAGILLFLNHLHRQNKTLDLPFPNLDPIKVKVRAALQKVVFPTLTLKTITWSLVGLLLCIAFFCYPKMTLIYIGVGLFFLVKDGTIFKKSTTTSSPTPTPIPTIPRKTTTDKEKTTPTPIPTPAPPKKVVKPKPPVSIEPEPNFPEPVDPNFPMGNEPKFPTTAEDAQNPVLPEPEAGDFKTLLASVLAKTVSATLPYPIVHDPSEEAFYKVLTACFPDRIYRDSIIELFEGKQPYIPEAIFKHRATNLHIDIEIDEPYVAKTGQPIHYAGYTPDNARNKYFNQKGWVVIRFAEEQVVKDPKGCCKVIADVVETLTGDKTYSRRLKNVDALSPVEQWTKEQAVRMAQQKYRTTYLK
ncbi:MAG: hypothetical protein RIS64_1693 [Bacteroidota bacterium]|jgi:hypothetical protein